jgi:hypothetical protein
MNRILGPNPSRTTETAKLARFMRSQIPSADGRGKWLRSWVTKKPVHITRRTEANLLDTFDVASSRRAFAKKISGTTKANQW